ncbi:MAG: carboxypeptidase-like regulatory domain-containing protein [Nitrososphaerales archaeon]
MNRRVFHSSSVLMHATAFTVMAFLLFQIFASSMGTASAQPSVPTASSAGGTDSSVTSGSSTIGPRIGLDLSWYIRNGFGSLHRVNSGDGTAVYEYLTNGWKDSGGLANGTCPSGDTCSGGFFTAYAYELHSPPLYPPQYDADANWLLAFIHAANADAAGQRAKIFIRLVAENNFDSTLLGTLHDFLQKLGPASQNPSVVGFGFRGAQEGIYEGGGTCCGGPEGNDFIPATIAYGPSGMNSFPQNASQYSSMWNQFQTLANAYGYHLGVSTGMSSMDKYLGQSVSDSYVQWFIGDTGYGACGQSDTTGTCTYNTWYSKIANPPEAASVAEGVVGGEWDQNWFVVNQPPYYITQVKIQAMFHGFSDGYAVNSQAGQYMFIYGMPYLTNDDPTWVQAKGPCPYMPWFLQYAQQYGFFTDFSPAPSAGTPGGGSSQPSTTTPTGIYIHILGNATLDSLKKGWTQTDPVICCGEDTYTIDGQLINLQTGQGIRGASVQIMSFDFTTCTWKDIATVTTNSQGYYGYPNGGGTPGTTIRLSSPSLPNTGRNQAYFYPAYVGNSTYGPSNGVLEDLPILPTGTTVTTTTSTSTSTSRSTTISTTTTSTSSTSTTSTSSTPTTTTSTRTTTTSSTTSTQSSINFSLALSSPSATGVLGSAVQMTASVMFPNGGSRPVSFSTSNLPAGVLVNVSTVQDGSAAMSLLTFKIASSATPGVYPIDIHATVRQTTESREFILTVQSSMLVTYTLSVSASPSEGGTTSLIPGTYTVPGGDGVNVTAYPAKGWSLDHWIVNGQYGGNGTSISLLITANSSLQAVFARGAPTPGFESVTFSSGSSTNESITIDGVNYSLPVSFSWQEGSQHEVEVAQVIYDGSQTRMLFIGWAGYPFSSSPHIDFVVSSSPSYDLSPSYVVQSKASFSFTDCKDSVISPADVVVQDSAGNTMSLNSSSSAWLDAGVSYQVVQVEWMGVNVADTSSGPFVADGPAIHQQQLRVCDVYIRIVDVFGYPASGASVVMNLGGAVQLVSDTNSSGVATFSQVPGGPFTAYLSYLGFSAWIMGSSLTQRELNATVVLSYPLMYAVGAFLVVLATTVFWTKLHGKGRRAQNLFDNYHARY